jgi:integral membrane protein
MKRTTSTVAQLRLAGIIEGISFLVLLFIAMPLKYGLDMPMAVRVVGSVHGLLFVGFALVLFLAHFERRWPLTRTGAVFAASVVPFGFVFIDRMLKRELAAQDATPTR